MRFLFPEQNYFHILATVTQPRMTSSTMGLTTTTAALFVLFVAMTTVGSVSVDVRTKSSSLTPSSVTSHDMDLIKLYLEEFRLELMSVKSQLARMARNSKLVRSSLKELRTSKCLNYDKDISLDYANIDCPIGFHLSSPTSCYRFSHDRVTWHEAQTRCRSLNSHLVAMESDSEQRFVKNHLTHTKKLQNCDFWTSGTDIEEEGTWVWNVTQSSRQSNRLATQRISTTSSHWQTGEPNNSNDQEHCLLLDWYARWAWNDASCGTERACYVCEIDM